MGRNFGKEAVIPTHPPSVASPVPVKPRPGYKDTHRIILEFVNAPGSPLERVAVFIRRDENSIPGNFKWERGVIIISLAFSRRVQNRPGASRDFSLQFFKR